MVHPLTGWQRRVVGVRLGHGPMAVGGPAGVDAVGEIARVTLDTAAGQAECAVVAVPDLPADLVRDQARALELSVRAARIAERQGARVVGLGSALAVVAGRGSALAELVEVPVTTGHAATAWAAAEITTQARGRWGGPVGVLGFKGTVGDAVATRLAAQGLDVRVEEGGAATDRRARIAGCASLPRADLLAECRVLVGASTTGPTLLPEELTGAAAALVDLSLPPTLHPGPRPAGLQVLAGETLRVPGWGARGFWGRVWLAMAGYGAGLVYACVAEPVAVATGRVPAVRGRRLDPQRVEAVGRALAELGFTPVLRSRGGRAAPSPRPPRR